MYSNTNSDFCYSKFDTSSSVITKYFEDNKNDLIYDDYYGFKVSSVPSETWLQEPILNKINDVFEIDRCGIIRIEPNKCYRWHHDTKRGVCVNLLLTPQVQSYTLFGHNYENSKDQFDILSLKYEPNSFYLFNNQIMHTVINFDKPRYLFTTEFVKEKNILSYNDILSWKEKLDIIDTVE